ncbi:M90 family metallopeptidase [Wenyingzhuangia sp. IMCC45533]
MILFIGLLLGTVLVVLLFNRRKAKPNVYVPSNIEELLLEHILFYQKLTKEERIIFNDKVADFLVRVNIDAVGFVLEDIDIAYVAASAIIPVFYLDDWEYANLSTVIIYPDYFDKDLNYKGKNRNVAGLVGTGRFNHQMILSRRALHHGFSNKSDKSNTAIHEFVHLIDKMDGEVDGIPKSLMDRSFVIPWLNLMHEKIEMINSDKSDIRAYGGTSKEEFFAVAAEYFFERPELLKRKHPDLYTMLERCFCKGTTKR